MEENAIHTSDKQNFQNATFSSSLNISFLTQLVIKVSSVTACRSLLQLLKWKLHTSVHLMSLYHFEVIVTLKKYMYSRKLSDEHYIVSLSSHVCTAHTHAINLHDYMKPKCMMEWNPNLPGRKAVHTSVLHSNKLYANNEHVRMSHVYEEYFSFILCAV